MKKQREELLTPEPRLRIIEQIGCNQCGYTVDLIPPMRRPDGWVTVYTEDAGYHSSWDFDDFECFRLWVEEHPEGFPSKLQEDIERSIEDINQKRAEAEATKILSGVE